MFAVPPACILNPHPSKVVFFLKKSQIFYAQCDDSWPVSHALRESAAVRVFSTITLLAQTVFSFNETALPQIQRIMAACDTRELHALRGDGWDYRILPDGLERLEIPRYRWSVKRAFQRQQRKHARVETRRLRNQKRFVRPDKDTLTFLSAALLYPRYKKALFGHSASGQTLGLRLRVPQTADNVPLVLCLHGAGVHGHDLCRHMAHFAHALHRLKKEHRACAVCLPQFELFQEYNTDESSALLGALIDTLCAQYPHMDRTRVYLLGVSYGGYATITECLRHPDRYAAAIPTVAWTYLDFAQADAKTQTMLRSTHLYDADQFHRPCTAEGYAALAQTPLWLAYSYLEAKYNEPLYAALQAIGAPVRATQIDKRGHAMSTLFFRDAAWTQWLLDARG